MKHIIDDAGSTTAAPHEARDCTVRAFAIAADMPYAQSHAILKQMGRKDRHGVQMANVMRTKMVGRVFNNRMPVTVGDTGITLKKYIELHCQQGRFLILIRGHALAVVDGVVYDSYVPKPRSIVRTAYRFKEVT